ncbi:MAG TPA: AAA family ATPase [Candidatus Acidoferrum sp.]|nr:AAA family ATPase [Candidatus Acidoferrum sp.]
MLTSLQIKNFRGFKALRLESLKRVNIVVGQNNTGKTGLLEALALLLQDPSKPVGDLPNLFRTAGGDSMENFWKWTYYNKDVKHAVEIRASGDALPEFGIWLTMENSNEVRPGDVCGPGTRLGYMQLSPVGHRPTVPLKPSIFSTHPTNPRQDAVDYNRVVLRRKKKDVEALLKKIEPRLEAIESLQTGSEPLLYADVGLSEMLPVTQMGQGFNRLLDIYSELVAAEAKVLLIDEVENGLHHSALPTIWRGLLHAAKDADVQIFATTHSLECIRAAHEVFSQEPEYDLSVIQLFRVPTGIEGRVLDRKHIEAAMAGEIDLR